MALQDIRQHIKDKAADEVREIKERSSEELAKLEEEWKDRIKDERERLVKEIERRATSTLAQAKFEIREQAKAQYLRAKMTQIDKVFDEASKELADLPKDDYVALLTQMLTQLKDEEGELLTSEKRVAELEQAVRESGCRARVANERIDTFGGFVFRSKKVDRDCRFETMLKRVREDSIIEVNDLLFSK